MSDKRLAEIKARCEAATPGPWVANVDRVYPVGWPAVATCHWQIGMVGGPEGHHMLKNRPDFGGGLWDARANAAFIAAAREDVPYLRAEVERLRAENAALAGERDRLREALEGMWAEEVESIIVGFTNKQPVYGDAYCCRCNARASKQANIVHRNDCPFAVLNEEPTDGE